MTKRKLTKVVIMLAYIAFALLLIWLLIRPVALAKQNLAETLLVRTAKEEVSFPESAKRVLRKASQSPMYALSHIEAEEIDTSVYAYVYTSKIPDNHYAIPGYGWNVVEVYQWINDDYDPDPFMQLVAFLLIIWVFCAIPVTLEINRS